MSLLNDALKDLDRSTQGGAQQDIGSRRGPGTGSSRLLHGKRLALPVLAALAVLVWLVVEFNILNVMPTKSVAPEIPEPIALNKKWLNVDVQAQAQDKAAAVEPVAVVAKAAPITLTASPTGVSSEAVEEATSVRAEGLVDKGDVIDGATGEPEERAVALLLEKAEQAFQQDHLTTPIEHNAHQLYSSVLLLEPGHPAALAGIEKIRRRYLQLAEKAMQEQAQSVAQLYLQRAQEMGAPEEQLELYRQSLNKMPTAPAQASTNRIRFDKDRDLAQRLRASPLGQYEHKAWLRINSDDPSSRTAIALADVYAGSQSIAQLRKLLDAIATGEPSVVAYVQAQWFVLNGNLASAASLLEAHAPAFADDPHHLRLLAGVQAGLHDYVRALPIYHQLTQMPDFNLNDWLGYAVALERVGNRRDALNAYQKISRIRHSDGRINDYIQARIRDLAGAIDQ